MFSQVKVRVDRRSPAQSGTTLPRLAAVESDVAALQSDVLIIPPAQQTPFAPIRGKNIVDACQANWSNHTGSGAISLITSDHFAGSGSVRIVTATSGSSTNAKKTLAAPVNLSGKNIGINLRIAAGDAERIDTLIFYTMDNNTGANYHAWTFYRGSSLNTLSIVAGEWQQVTLSYAGGSIVGSDPRASVGQVRLVVKPDAGYAVTVDIGAVFSFDEPASGAVCLTFDDGYSEWMEAARRMAAYGYAGTGFIIAEKLDTAGFLTTQNVLDLRDKYGWEIAMHGDIYWQGSGAGATTDIDEYTDYLLTQRAALLRLGSEQSAAVLAYPGGRHDLDVHRSLRQFVAAARTIDAILPETLPPANRMAMRATSSVTDYAGGVSIAEMLNSVDAALAHKALCIPVFHQFETVATGTTVCSWGSFDTFLSGLSSRNVPPRVLSDVLR